MRSEPRKDGHMKKITAVVRRECVHEVVHSLLGAGAARVFVSHVHALGAGVDPERFQLSLEEGEAYTEKAKIEVLCRPEEVEGLVETVRRHACAGHRGDGVIAVGDVERVVSVRTGEEGVVALL